MRSEPFEFGPGKVWILEAPGHDEPDWSQLPEELVGITPETMLDAWHSFPRYFADAAGRARLPAFGIWLDQVADGEARLRLYDTPPAPRGFGRAALLEVAPAVGSPVQLDFRSRGRPCAQHPLPANEADWPPRVPFALQEVHRTVGGIHAQYGASGLLFPPDAMHPLEQLGPYVRDFLEQGRNPRSIEDMLRAHVLYDAYGDVLVLTADGEAVWVAMESGYVTSLGSVSRALEALFASLLSEERFAPQSDDD